MTYYINPICFYLISVLEGLQVLFLVISISSVVLTVFIILILVGLIGDDDCEDIQNKNEKIVGIFKKVIIVGIVSFFIGILIPTKETCIEMLVASQVTHENVSNTKEEIYNIIDYIVDKVNGKESKE